MEELPQNLKTVLQEIGEMSALLYLYMVLTDEGIEGWKVFRNYADEGCDLVLKGPADKQINLEVKTRQSLMVARNKNQVQFTVTKKERESSDFVLAYWFNKSVFFIVPTDELVETSSNGKPLFKFTARYSESNLDFTDVCRHYANDWHRITEACKNAMHPVADKTGSG